MKLGEKVTPYLLWIRGKQDEKGNKINTICIFTFSLLYTGD